MSQPPLSDPIAMVLAKLTDLASSVSAVRDDLRGVKDDLSTQGRELGEVKGTVGTLSNQYMSLTSRMNASEGLVGRAMDQSQRALQASSDTAREVHETNEAMKTHVALVTTKTEEITRQNAETRETLTAQNDVLEWIKVNQTRIFVVMMVLGQGLGIFMQSYLRARGH